MVKTFLLLMTFTLSLYSVCGVGEKEGGVKIISAQFVPNFCLLFIRSVIKRKITENQTWLNSFLPLYHLHGISGCCVCKVG